MEVEDGFFNLDDGIEKCFGKLEVFHDMVESFLSEVDPLLVQMRDALKLGNTSEMALLAHRLLNTVVYLGCASLMEVVRQIEKAGQTNDLDQAGRKLMELEAQTVRLKRILAKHRKQPSTTVS